MLVKSLDTEPGKKVVMWNLVVIRSSGMEMEILSQSYDTREAAELDGRRMYSWVQMVQIAVVPSTCDFQSMALIVDPFKKLEVAAQ